MDVEPDMDCIGTLLDVLCYELVCGRLSQEMEQILRNHIFGCESCRQEVQGYLGLLGKPHEMASRYVS